MLSTRRREGKDPGEAKVRRQRNLDPPDEDRNLPASPSAWFPYHNACEEKLAVVTVPPNWPAKGGSAPRWGSDRFGKVLFSSVICCNFLIEEHAAVERLACALSFVGILI
jgi:hypothetical protein